MAGVDIVVEGLECRRGDFILTVDRLSISCGEKVAVLGENGSGKTTFLLALAGMLRCRGDVLYNGVRVRDMTLKERARLISYMPQHPEVSFAYTVFEVVLMGRYPWFRGGFPGPVDEEATRDVLARFGLGHLSGRRFQTLSGGERRRVLFARVVNQGAKVMLLDEPTDMMDVRGALEVMDYIKGFGGTVVAVLHDVNLALRYFGKAILMRDGRVVYYGDTGEVDDKILADIYGVGFSLGMAYLPG